MTKTFYILGLSLVSAALLSGCSSNEEIVPDVTDGKVPINFATVMEAPSTRGTNALQTDAFVSGYTATYHQNVGLYIYRTGERDKSASVDQYGYVNNKYDVSDPDASKVSALTKSTGTEQAYFPGQNTPVDIYAYAPYQVSPTDVNKFADLSVATDQSAALEYLKADFVSGQLTNTPFTSDEATAHNIPMTHRMSRVIVVLKTGDGITDADLQGAKVTLLNVQNSFDFDPLAATAPVTTKGRTTDIIMGTVPADAASEAARTLYAIIPPQTIQAPKSESVTNEPLVIQIDLSATNKGAVYKLITTKDQKFDPGTQYTYTITVDATAISFTTSIAAWGSTTAQTGTAVLQ